MKLGGKCLYVLHVQSSPPFMAVTRKQEGLGFYIEVAHSRFEPVSLWDGDRACVWDPRGPRRSVTHETHTRNVRHPRAVHDASAEDSSVPIKGGEDAADGLDETRPSRLITLMPGDASGDLNESHHALPSRLATDASSSHVPPLEGIPLRFCGVQGESNVEREGEDIIGAMTSETDGEDGRAKEVRHPKYSAG